MRPVDLFFLVSCLLPSVASDTNGGFIYPGPNGPDLSVPWRVGEFRPLEWNCTYTDYNLTLWTSDPPTLVGLIWSTTDGNGQGIQSFTWLVSTYSADATVNQKYMLWAGFEKYHNSESGTVSWTFNITDQPVDSTNTASTSTTGSTSSTTAATETDSATSTSATPTAVNQSTNDAPASSSQPSSNNDSLKLGLGVGLGVGIPLLLGLGFLIGWLWKRGNHGDKDHKKQAPAEISKEPLSEHTYSVEPKAPPRYESPPPAPLTEAPATSRPVELDSARQMSELA